MSMRKWKHRAPQKAFSREQRKGQILGQFGIWKDNEDTEPKTMNRIARALGMSPSTAITVMLLEMVEAGDLVVEQRDQKGKWTTRFYALSEARTLSRVVLKRRVVVKHRGVVSGQLEMQI